MTIQSITLPLQNPVLIFALVLLIILLSPIVLRKLRIPGIIGLILAGVIIGPNGLNILLRDSSIVLFSTVGLLYIMLLSGLEIDMVQFRRSRHRSIFFGMATFLLPQVLGTMIGYYYLHFNLSTSTLLASMFASHTLITYPIANKLGLVQTEAVTIAIGGTIITNTLSLLILSIIVQLKHNALDISFIMQIILLAGFFGILIFWGVPRLTRWFFNNFAGEGYAHFLFVLVIAFLSASIAQLAKLEPIIGVFLAGIALNRLIPTNSSLMNRIEFVGNTLFIPFFLIGVGMLVDLKVLFQDSEAIKVAVAMTVVATATKWLAAFLTQLVYGYSSTQRRIIFGLTNGQAAATLAAVTIGYNLRLLNENVLNGSLLMILVTCLIASFATESAARKLALELDSNPEQLTEKPERILVPVSNPETVEKLIELAILVKDPMSAEPIYPLTVIQDTNSTDQQIAYCRKLMQHTIKQAAAADTVLQLVTRIDLNIASGIIRALNELQITTLIIGWNAKMTTQEKIFGSVLDTILHNSNQTIMVCKLLQQLNTYSRIRLFVPPLSHHEKGFIQWLKLMSLLSKQTGTRLEIISSKESIRHIVRGITLIKPQIAATFIEDNDMPDIKTLAGRAGSGDLFVFVSSRRTAISYQDYLDDIPYLASKYFENHSFIVIYPEQGDSSTYESTLQLDEDSLFPYHKSLSIIEKLQNLVSNMSKRNIKQ